MATPEMMEQEEIVFEEALQERYELAVERIREIEQEHLGESVFEQYFRSVASFLLLVEENRSFLLAGGLDNAPLEELAARNHALYEEVLPEHYESSYANPAYAVAQLGQEYGSLLSFLYTELRSCIGFAYEGRLQELVIRFELFNEIYASFVYEWQEEQSLPKAETIRKVMYWFISDYADVAAMQRVQDMVIPGGFGLQLLEKYDFSDARDLYRYGEYVSDNELTMCRFMAQLPQETVNTMADTYTEGYRIGFEVTNKDLSKKKSVSIHYQLGFERMMKRAVENFRQMGLGTVLARNPYSILYNKSLGRSGFYGGNPNRQYDFDHRDDRALFWDKNLANRRLEVMHTAFEEYKEACRGYAGPAVVETFGEKQFEPVNKPQSPRMSEEQNDSFVEFRSQMGRLQRQYILEEERSFTIIAFPVPEIGEDFPELFKEIIRINTLDYQLYRDMQQCIIEALDQADYCIIKGMGQNRTDLKINLWKLQNPEKETIFENCVADVNIPVGEVFTSPVLTGTEGLLHVSRVFLNDLEYRNLTLTFEDGMIKDYTCDNFKSEEENRDFIRENVLYRHKTLPMGEFAIGTNTTAYVVARKFGVEDKFPILIAEKMGPHFAVGDTCYSNAEDVAVYNPDGKEIVARENDFSRLRKENPSKAYFNCHTDITIPYDELGELSGVTKEGRVIPIIKEGRFVLPGTEKLNAPLEEV